MAAGLAWVIRRCVWSSVQNNTNGVLVPECSNTVRVVHCLVAALVYFQSCVQRPLQCSRIMQRRSVIPRESGHVLRLAIVLVVSTLVWRSASVLLWLRQKRMFRLTAAVPKEVESCFGIQTQWEHVRMACSNTAFGMHLDS
jgi:hypothetical protein